MWEEQEFTKQKNKEWKELNNREAQDVIHNANSNKACFVNNVSTLIEIL